MKKFIAGVSAVLMTAMSTAVYMPEKTANADNPAIQTIYSTDPAPMVYNDTLYLYTGRDKDNSDFYHMPDWHCYSTKDMQNWTDHGTILSWDSFSWGKEDSAWAAQCIERNGKFYYYVTLENNTGGGRAIGVAVADSPTGPFKDAIGKPLVGPNWDYIDPTVFIDDDGQAYLMFGNPTCYYIKLNEDMISYSGNVEKFDMTTQAFGSSTERDTSYGEGPWLYKRNDLYYLLYASFYGSDSGESLGYSTASSPTGPWTYRGQVMKTHNCYTNHPGVIDYKGKSYLFYHDASLKGGGTFNRSVCVDEFEYGADGSIPTITPTKTGPEQIESLNPFVKTEAETICYSEGIKTEVCSNGGLDVANIEKGDYIKVKGVDFGSGADKFTASVASDTEGGVIEIHTESPTGPIIGVCEVGYTGGWQTWEEVSCDVVVEGEHDLYFVFSGGSGYLLNVDWWKFSGPGSAPAEPAPEGYLYRSNFEGNEGSWTGRGDAEIANDTAAFEGRNSLKVTNRSSSWNGAIIELDDSFKPGSTYSFSVNAMTDKCETAEKFHFTMQYNDADGEAHYEKISTSRAVKGKWVQLANQNFTIPSGAEDVCIYVETAAGKNDFYIDDAVIAVKGTPVSGAMGGTANEGDVDRDGVIDAFDVVLARKAITGKLNDSMALFCADADNSGKYEVNDLVLIQKFVNGEINAFPDNTPEPEPEPEPEPSDFNYDPALSYREAPSGYLGECSQAGTVVKETYNGIHGSNTLNVYLPYGYDENKKYNIFYLMHGGGENENTIFSDDVKLDHILDHMIMNGELEPLIVVTPTFNKSGADKFYEEFRKSVVPFVEGKYSTYAASTSEADLRASRMHRAYGGFSMGSLSTWCVANHAMDLVGYFMPLSGDNWEGMGTLTNQIDSLGYKKNEYFIFAATGDEDIAYNNMVPQMNDLKSKTNYFTYTSDFSKGNLYFLVAPGKTHWWGFVRHYVYDALPYFFHENQ